MKAAKVDTKIISAALGHSRTSFTDSQYVSLFPEVQKAAADAAAAVVPRKLLHRTLQICSVSCMKDLTIRQARELLTSWAAEQVAVTARRDDVVRTAIAAGVSKSEIQRLTRIARSTIDRIIAAGCEA
ncbi:MAG TPA: hypothetical protein VGG75_40910 [Trebonia sp.]|jgi:hypothetical protein